MNTKARFFTKERIIFYLVIFSIIMVLSGLLFTAGISGGRPKWWPVMKPLEAELRMSLKEYHRLHGVYPDSLQKLEVAYGKVKGAKPEMLLHFIYRKEGDTYYLRIPMGM